MRSQLSSRRPARPFVIRAVFATLVLLGASLLLAQVFDTTKVEATFDWDLYKEYKTHEVVTLAELVQDFEYQQAQWMPIAPPSTECWGWTQEASPTPMPFDQAGFPKDFLAGLVPASRGGVTIFPLTVWEDPKSRDRVFYNADGKEIGSVPAQQDYDPRWCLAEMYPDLATQSWTADYVDWLTLVYDPSHLQIRFDLILDDDLIKWVLAKSIRAAARKQAAAQLAALGGTTMLMRSPLADSNIVIQSCAPVTNGISKRFHESTGDLQVRELAGVHLDNRLDEPFDRRNECDHLDGHQCQ
jgi:hypothetical protein